MPFIPRKGTQKKTTVAKDVTRGQIGNPSAPKQESDVHYLSGEEKRCAKHGLYWVDECAQCVDERKQNQWLDREKKLHIADDAIGQFMVWINTLSPKDPKYFMESNAIKVIKGQHNKALARHILVLFRAWQEMQ